MRRPRKIEHVACRAAPAGAVTFGVKHTEGVSVEVAARGRAEVGPAPSGTRWPLDEGMVLRFSMSRASAEVNDNKVKFGVLGTRPPPGWGWRASFPKQTNLGISR